MLAESIPHLPQLQSEIAVAIVCRGTQCLPPVTTPEELLRTLGSY
jgi:uncharacterized protein YyaL (SSP411 family)